MRKKSRENESSWSVPFQFFFLHDFVGCVRVANINLGAKLVMYRSPISPVILQNAQSLLPAQFELPVCDFEGCFKA